MHSWEAIQKAVDYIEENLHSEVKTDTLASMVSLSSFYFQRLFRRLVNKPVQEYIKLRRLSKAVDELNSNEQRILDIALNYGFSSHANFTRSFKEAYGITPEEYKKTRPMLNTVIKPEISMNYVLIDEGVPIIIEDMVIEVRREKLAVTEYYIGLLADVNIISQNPVGESTGIDVPGQLWKKFHKEKTMLIELVIPSIELGMSYMADFKKGIFKYFAGALLKRQFDGLDNFSAFTTQELPMGNYIVCKIEADSFERLVTEALDKATKYLFDTWLPNHQLISEPFSAEKYYMYGDCVNYMEIWIKLLERNNLDNKKL